MKADVGLARRRVKRPRRRHEEREDVALLTQKKLLAAKIERAMSRRNITQAEHPASHSGDDQSWVPEAGATASVASFNMA